MLIPKIVVLEGLNGVGKTTIGTKICERLGGDLVKTPSSLFSESRLKVDESADLLARFLFYIAGTYQASIDVINNTKSSLVVFDRYFYSTLCSHRALGLQVEIPKFVVFPKPDHVFLIVCGQTERIKRMTNRGMSINDQRERCGNVEAKTLSEFRSFGMIEVDNSTNCPNIAINNVLSIIGMS